MYGECNEKVNLTLLLINWSQLWAAVFLIQVGLTILDIYSVNFIWAFQIKLNNTATCVYVYCMYAHLSQYLHTRRKVLACGGMSQCVFTHKGDHLVEGRHANMLHCWRFLCFIHIHQSPENIKCISQKQAYVNKKNKKIFPFFPNLYLLWCSSYFIFGSTICLYWRDKVLSVDSSLGQAFRWRSHGVGLKLLDVPA